MYVSVAVLLCIVSMSTSDTNSSGLPNKSTNIAVTGEKLLDDILSLFEKIIPGLQYLGKLPFLPATSCQQIAKLMPDAKSGFYWIQDKTGPTRVYCKMGFSECGGGTWTRVANVNMTVNIASCPMGLEKVTSPKTLCRKRVNIGCSSAMFFTYGLPFTNVCGQVIGYQIKTPDAFRPFYKYQTRTIDDVYVDGVSITHSSSPREHIWTFAAGVDETPVHTSVRCPCSNFKSHVAYHGVIPPFVGHDYFCETGSPTYYSFINYLDDPLWDGKGCGIFSTCCDGDRKPWFIKKLSDQVTSDIEVRLCTDQGREDEDMVIEQLYLFVQ